MQIRHGVIEAVAAEAADKHECLVAELLPHHDGAHHIGNVLFNGELNGADCLRRALCGGVKIADDKVGANAVLHSGVVARIRTDDVVLFRIEFFKNGAGRQRSRADDHTFFVFDNCHSFMSFTSLYIAM